MGTFLITALVILVLFIFSPILGVYRALRKSSDSHVILSLFIPLYGYFYFFASNLTWFTEKPLSFEEWIINCPHCQQSVSVDLNVILTGHRPGCPQCGTGLILDQLENPIQPTSVSFNPDQTIKVIEKKRFFPIRHWRGDLSLPVSFWLIAVLANWLINLVLLASDQYFASMSHFYPFGIWIGFLVLNASIVAITVWTLCGLWRSANNYQKKHNFNRKFLYGSWAKVAVCGGILQFLPLIAYNIGPQFIELTAIAFRNDPRIPQYKLTIEQNGTEIKIKGGLKYGLIKDLNSLLAANQAVKTINLESNGGRAGIADDLFTIIENRRLNTVVNNYCYSACALAFAGGTNRWLGYKARLGFHSGSFPGISQKKMAASLDGLHQRISRKNGTSKIFFKRVLTYPPSKMWYPKKEELMAQRYITSYQSGAQSSFEKLGHIFKLGIAERKKLLPKKLDNHTLYSDIYIRRNRLIFVYHVTSFIQKIAKQRDYRRLLQQRAKKNLCQNNSSKQNIVQGLVYGYLYLRKKTKEKVTYFEVKNC